MYYAKRVQRNITNHKSCVHQGRGILELHTVTHQISPVDFYSREREDE